MFLNIFLIFVTIVFLVLAVIWVKKSYLNMFLKMLFTIGLIWSIIETLIQFGWIIKLPVG